MSILNHSPSIVRNGLVLCLDAGAVRSYPGAGPQLVVNGDFASDITTGWEAGGSTTGQSHDTGGDGGRLKLVDGGGNSRLYSSAAITLVVGQKYRFSVTVSGTSTNHFVHSGTSLGGVGNPVTNFTLGGGDGTYVHDFVATATTFYIHLGATGGSTQYYDQVSLVAIASNLSLPGDSGYSSGVSYGVPGANQWSDLSGNNNNVSLVNMQYDLDAESGAGGTRSFDFDGSSDKMSIVTDSIAIHCFQIAIRNDSSIQAQVGFTADGVHFNGLTIGSWTGTMDDETIAWWGYGTGAGSGAATYIKTVVSTDWHIITANWTGSTSTGYDIWIDGVKQTVYARGGGSGHSGLLDGVTAMHIGWNEGWDNYFNGRIAFVRAYNRSLTDGEILQNYKAHKGRFGK